MCANGKTVRFIPQSLNIVEHRIARLEHERRLTGQMKVFTPGIPIRSFGNARQQDILDPEFIQNCLRG